MDQLAQQVAHRLESMGLLMAENYEFDTARIVTPWKGHWAFGTWRWVMIMNAMGGDKPESVAGSPWPIEDCLASHTWEVVDQISDSTIVPFISQENLDNKLPVEDHPALVQMFRLYPDFLASDNYRYRLTTYVDGIMYVSQVPLDSETLVKVLRRSPAGLHALEFMLKKDDPNRGLAWKMLWSE